MIELLRHFVAVAEAGTFTAAARRVHLSQPALTASIQRLEALVGGAVRVRGRRGAEPTDVGRALLPRARGPSEASAALDGVERTSTVPDVKLAVAGLEMRTTVSVIDRPPPDHCSGRPDVARTTVGAIGIDVLRRCVIVIASNDAVLRCE